ncbi:MAG TPA: phosphate ABC transporter permease subunit PstC [Bacillota bacterium]|nr:phosphate ABC transporter permease subunit PstC [Bacillota bacterium]
MDGSIGYSDKGKEAAKVASLTLFPKAGNKASAEKRTERIIKGGLMLCALLSVLVVLLITVMVFKEAWPAIKQQGLLNMITGTSWKPTAAKPRFGLLPMIAGSFAVTALALLIGVPVGLATAIYGAELATVRVAPLVGRMAGILAGIPSVVYGFFGLMVIVPAVRLLGGTGMGVLSAGVVLAMMILPTVISVSEAAIRAVPGEYREASLAMGATKWQTIWHVVIPAAKSGIMASVVLAIGRAVGETMAVILVAGNIPVIPKGLLSATRTLTVNIALEMGYVRPGSLHYSALFAAAAVLFAFIMLINLSVRMITRGGSR